MRLCIDIQGAQTESRFRGIGRYTANFVKALAATAGSHELCIVTNGALMDHAAPLLADLARWVPRDAMCVFGPPGRVAQHRADNEHRARIAQAMREACIANMRPDAIYVSSVVEGWLDDAVTSIGEFESSARTAATFYDAIPLLREQDYLGDPRYRAFYRRKIDSLRRADLLLAISEHARAEAIAHLGVDADKVVAVGCGIDLCFDALTSSRRDAPPPREGQDLPYVLYAGGFDGRKNVGRLVEAYGRLEEGLRRRHRLVIGGRIGDLERRAILRVASAANVSESEISFTGGLDDDALAALYRGAELFVFPSLHEGFGLPVAEAMACGAPVIASRTTSMPEVIGRDDALFDPTDVESMAALMHRVLSEDAFRADLRTHGPKRARTFTWEAAAARAWPALEAMHARSAPRKASVAVAGGRRLAVVSPLPPDRTGVADYTVGLLTELGRHYDVEVVSEQPEPQLPATLALPVRSLAWFDTNAAAFDRILYHVGNSPFHVGILQLMKRHPGTVVMHDFFMTGMLGWLEDYGGDPTALRRSLYASHGYPALVDERREGRAVASARYPASRAIFEQAAGIVVHSQHSLDLALQWYGERAIDDAVIVPHHANAGTREGRAAARRALGIPDDAFVACSFGFLAPTKLNDRLLAAWRTSGLDADPRAWLVFVGENEGGAYGRDMQRTLGAMAGKERVRITGFVDEPTYERYLAAADIAVQLRTGSRGETSGAILRALAAGVPTLVNAHGAAGDYPADVVCRLPDQFDDHALAASLLRLHGDASFRTALRDAARRHVQSRHSLAAVACQYRDALEHFATASARARERRVVRAAAVEARARKIDDADLVAIAQSLAAQRPQIGARQLLVDVTVVARTDLRTGIERVVRGVLNEWLRNPPTGYRVEPVRDDGSGRYVYARQYTQRALGLPEILRDEVVEVRAGDVFVGLDWYADGIPRVEPLLRAWRHRGVQLYFVVYDILPVTLPDAFPPTSKPMVEAWLATMARVGDGIACISKAVADDLGAWLEVAGPVRRTSLPLGYFPLGSTVADTIPTTGVSAAGETALARVAGHPAFLMVGTVEPRKAHAEVLAAFETLWQRGADFHLVIIGKQGWMMDELAARLRAHPEVGSRLFWFDAASDELLERFYGVATALIAASRGEGFGLPIVEAARHGVPVIARDLPVFREVAGEHAAYFDDDSPHALAASIERWMAQCGASSAPQSHGIGACSWAASAAGLRDVLLGGSWYRAWSGRKQ